MRCLGILVLVFWFAVTAAALTPTNLLIDVQIAEDGSAHIVENYDIEFDTVDEVEQFKRDAQENGSSMLAWKVDYPWFFPHMGDERIVSRTYVLFNERTRAIVLDYFIEGPFATLVEDAPREQRWRLSDKQLRAFQSQGLLVIPENATVKIELPEEAVINREQLSERANVVENSVVLSGLTTNYVNLQWEIAKPIAPLNVFRLFSETFGANFFIVAAFILLAVVVLLWKREQIVSRIEDYVVEHSEIKGAEPEEDVDVELQ